ADAALAQRVGERVRAAVDVGERERPEVVDERRAVGEADRADRVARGRGRPERVQRAHGLRDPVGARPRDDARPGEGARGEELLEEPVLDVHGTETYVFFGSFRSPGASPRSMSAWMSPARRGLRNTWRWPTLGFSASRPASSMASPTASASL